MYHDTASRYTAMALGLLVAGSMVGCGGDNSNNKNSTCEGPEVIPQQSPVFFREAYPPPEDGSSNLGNPERTPYEWTLQLQSQCKRDVNIQEVCVVGPEEGDDATHFQIEGPKPETATRETDSLARLTYTRETPNSGDDIDRVAIVVQSNANNFPTLIVPVCARVIEGPSNGSGDQPDAGPQREIVQCQSPVTVPKGEKQSGLCGDSSGS